MATLFFGGWDIPFTVWDNVAPHLFIKTLATFLFFWLKILVFVFIYIWIRWTLPRFRYDQLMSLGWKVMLPTILAYIVVVAGATLGLSAVGITYDSWQFSVIMLGVNIVLMVLLFGFIDRGRLISPAYSQLDKRNLAKLQAVRFERAQLRPATTEGGAD